MDDPFGSDDPFGIAPSDFQAPAHHTAAIVGDDFSDFGVEPPHAAPAHVGGDAFSAHDAGVGADPFGDVPSLSGTPPAGGTDAGIHSEDIRVQHEVQGADEAAGDVFMTQIAPPVHEAELTEAAAQHGSEQDVFSGGESMFQVVPPPPTHVVEEAHVETIEPPLPVHQEDVAHVHSYSSEGCTESSATVEAVPVAMEAPIVPAIVMPTPSLRASEAMSIPVPTLVSARGGAPPGVETPSMITPIGGSFSMPSLPMDGIDEHAPMEADTPAPAPELAAASSAPALDDAETSDILASATASLSSVTLSRPSAPQLVHASINGLTVKWDAVPGASAYIVDYEIRSQTGSSAPTHAEGVWTGRGGRVVQEGSHLLTAVQVHIPGLQKRSAYVCRVTAVRVRRLVLPDGNAFEQSVESSPSPVSAFMYTLDAAAEVARLTRVNAELTTLSERIPVLEEEAAERERMHGEVVAALNDDLSNTRDALAAAVAEIERLQGDITKRVSELDEAHARIRELYGNLETRSAELGESRADGRHTHAQLTGKIEELARANAEIERLNAAVASRGADLDRASTDAQRLSALVTERDAAIAAHLAKIAELEGMVVAKERARADASTKAATLAGQISTLSEDKDVVIMKVTDDLGKVMEEMQRVQNQLHKAQDYVAYIEPFAKMVMDIRERQRRWDEEHDAIQHGAAAAGASPFGKMSASRKLGPRPTITL